jgi:predicted DNA-binding protein
MRRTNIHIADDQIERLKALAKNKGVSYAELVRRAIEVYLDREEKRAERKGRRP